MLNDLALRATMVQSVRVLAELIQEFNETWFRTQRNLRR
jgi:hypothetical protein